MAGPKKILFLYTEIAGYFLACVRGLLEHHQVEVHLVRWPVNKEAPFEFDTSSDIHLYQRNDYEVEQLLQLAKDITPDVIVCSGWIDKGYLKVVKQFSGEIPTVLTLDNHWLGSMKQRVATLASPFVLKNKFSHAWVPGNPQRIYAEKLGFKNILTGFYSADVPLFEQEYEKNKRNKSAAFPHRFIYIGRYLEFKGIFDMWNAFLRLKKEHPNDWEFWCLGTGDLYDQRVEHEDIHHFGFVQPSELSDYIAQTGIFVLPSHKEPWAVTVHEFAASGFPLICSDKVGAIDRFVEDGKNGHVFEAGNEQQLFEVMKSMVQRSDDELFLMGEASRELARQITPQKWAKTLMGVLE